ncbi:MAG: cell division protein ZapA [Clostridia bacterium]|nr:cell division protein ZapA [Clostridia bacterium]
MEKKNVRFYVFGAEFRILTGDSEEYIRSIAADTEARIRRYHDGGKVTGFQAAVLTAMEFAEENRRKETILDNIKQQLKSYLDDAARIKTERDQYKEAYEKLLEQSKKGE